MHIVLHVLAALMMLAGLYGLVMGWDIIMVERGWSQFIAGATAFSAGAVIVALLHVAREVKKLRGDITGLVVEVDEPAVAAVPAPQPAVHEPTPVAAPAAETPPVAEGERVVVGTYASGGVTYFMYGDHSIEAELQDGRHRFSSMEELRTYLDTGTGGMVVRKGPPAE